MRCPFCDIVAGTAPATIVESWRLAMAIKPLNPVTRGHVLVIPKRHVNDAAEHPLTTALVMGHASKLAREFPAANIITSIGVWATQTIFHLHVHVVPRIADDGLKLPWSSDD